MQILKDEIRNRILKAALAEFKNDGFVNASMRNIAKAAGITNGNIYRYYSNKEALFEAVIQPVYDQYASNLYEMYQKVEQSYIGEDRYNTKYFDNIEMMLIRLFKTFTAEMSILFNQSEGSKYESVKTDLIGISFSTLESMIIKAKKSESGLTEYEAALARMIASSLVEGMCLILRDNEEGIMFNKLVDQFLSIYSQGIKSVMKQIESNAI